MGNSTNRILKNKPEVRKRYEDINQQTEVQVSPKNPKNKVPKN
tara:strand:+ start:247 stop:375 length:129 start_codon:yes stop_codon:yes gene_type:complete